MFTITSRREKHAIKFCCRW